MKRHLKRIFTLSVGTAFLLLGVVGLFLPFLQGILFIVLGLVILSKESKTALRILEHWKSRHPKLHAKIGEYTTWIKRRFGMKVEDH